jgi:hypothetical protein
MRKHSYNIMSHHLPWHNTLTSAENCYHHQWLHWHTVKPACNVPWVLYNIWFQWFKANNLSVKLPSFKIFLSLVNKSTGSKRNLKQGLHCILNKHFIKLLWLWNMVSCFEDHNRLINVDWCYTFVLNDLLIVFQRDPCALRGTMEGTEDWMMTSPHLRSSIGPCCSHVMKVHHHNASSMCSDWIR